MIQQRLVGVDADARIEADVGGPGDPANEQCVPAPMPDDADALGVGLKAAKDRYDGFEVWRRKRCLYRSPPMPKECEGLAY